MASTVVEEENIKARDNAMFKKLEELGMKIPNDPILYKQDVLHYSDLFKIEFQKVQGDTMKKNQRYGELLIFLARCIPHFPQPLGYVAPSVMGLLNELGPSLHHYNRKKSAAAIMILRAKNLLYPVSTMQFLIKLTNIEDKALRKTIFKYLINDVRRMNVHSKNKKINQEMRANLAGYINKHADKAAQKSLQLILALYKSNLWTDTRTVNAVADACFSTCGRLRLLASHFLINSTEPLQEIADSDDEPVVNPNEIKFKKGITKHTKGKEKQVEKEKRRAERRLRKRQMMAREKNEMAIDVIYSPQNFVQKLFNIMSNKNQKWAHRQVYMALIARMVWRHKLILLPFYRALIKYLQPKQKDVHRVLTYFAESVHQLVPEDEIEVIVNHIVQHFVNDRCSQFTMTMGLNTLREVFKKLPSIITEEMMLYLATYYDYRNKNVSRAAKALINYVRSYNPFLLEKRYRGNNEQKGNRQEFEEKKVEGVLNHIPGAQLLGHEGSVPLEMDKIMTDDDFKRIRKLIRKRDEEEEWGKKVDNPINSQQGQNEEDDEGQEEEELQQGQDEEESEQGEEGEQQEQVEGQQQEGEGEGEQSVLQLDSEQFQQGGQQDQLDIEDQDYLSEQDGNIELDDSDLQGLQFEDEEGAKVNKDKNKTKKIKKQDKSKPKAEKKKKIQRKVQVEEQQSSDQEEEQQQMQDDNHGFLNVNQIAYYKMSKTQLKAQKKNIKEGKEKFKHTPKEKKGGTTNREKQKFKPLMMVRSKKNKIRNNQKQLKLKIKNLKNQLGKVRSGKEAKKMKNKIIKKKK